MALKSSIVNDASTADAVTVEVSDELLGISEVLVISLSECRDFAADLLQPGESIPGEIIGGVAQAIAVRRYLEDIGEDPDHPRLG